MNKTIKILTVLLAAQLLLAVGVGLTDRGITVTNCLLYTSDAADED